MNHRIIKFGLSKKIALLVVVVEIFAFSFFGSLYSEKYILQMETNLRDRLYEINKMISIEETPIGIISRVPYMTAMIGCEYISGYVVGNNNYVIVSNENKYLGRNIKGIPQFNPKWLHEERDIIYLSSKNNLTSISYLSRDKNEKPLYRIIMHVDTSKLNSQKNDIVLLSILGALFFVIISSVTIFVLARIFLTKRIEETLITLDQVKNGNLKAKVVIKEMDEIGYLQSRINSLIKQVDKLISKYEESIKEIENSKRFTKEILDSTPVNIFWKDINGRFLGVNRLFLNHTNLKKESEIIGKTDFEMPWKDNAEKFIEDDLNVIKNRKANLLFEEILTDKDNNNRYLLTSKIPLINEKDEVYGVLGVFHDITELKKAQEDIKKKDLLLIEQSKLASMGEMIGNIAHQWRQPLSAITINASGIQLKAEMGDIEENDLVNTMDSIIFQAKYLSDTIDNFRNFVKGKRTFKQITLNSSIETALSLTDSALSNNFIQIIKDIDESVEILGNKNELSEVLINILNNAKDSLKNNQNENERFLFITTSLIENRKVELSIKDNAGGIPEEIINRIFEPYFTTKHQSLGTGLGLSIANQIIGERHNGVLKVENEIFTYNNKEYKGANFKIVLEKKN